LTLYTLEYDPRTESELRKLPVRVQRRVVQQLEYLRAAPYRSHPGVHVKPTRDLSGVWHFHAAADVRVFYTTQGSTLWVVLIERSRGVTRKTIRALRRRR
jgi:mRNA-degrading endonuclease RelE of RelBE toxin-antitoxin system